MEEVKETLKCEVCEREMTAKLSTVAHKPPYICAVCGLIMGMFRFQPLYLLRAYGALREGNRVGGLTFIGSEHMPPPPKEDDPPERRIDIECMAQLVEIYMSTIKAQNVEKFEREEAERRERDRVEGEE